jgi:hypothetical protein
MALWNHIELPFLSHGVYSVVDAVQMLIGFGLGAGWIGLILWALGSVAVRFPTPFFAASLAWFSIYLLFSKTVFSGRILAVIFIGVLFVLFSCGLAWYIEAKTAREIRDSRYSPPGARNALRSFWMKAKNDAQ